MKRRASHYAIAAGISLLLAVTAGGLWWLKPGVDLEEWRDGRPPAAWSALERQAEVWNRQGVRRAPQHRFVPLEELGVELPVAVLTAEDAAFFDHGTVDVRQVLEAVVAWWRGDRLRGASTVSQQLAKGLFLSPQRSLRRKVTEVKLAWWLERRLGKRRILELYLNTVEFGPGLFGADVAAHHYHGVPTRSLSPAQAAGLAAAIPSPGRDNPDTRTRLWSTRRERILRRVRRAAALRSRVAALTGRPSLVNQGRGD